MDLAFLIENPDLLDDLDAELEKLVDSLTQTTRVVDDALGAAPTPGLSASLAAPAPDTGRKPGATVIGAPAPGRKVRPQPARLRPRPRLALA